MYVFHMSVDILFGCCSVVTKIAHIRLDVEVDTNVTLDVCDVFCNVLTPAPLTDVCQSLPGCEVPDKILHEVMNSNLQMNETFYNYRIENGISSGF